MAEIADRKVCVKVRDLLMAESLIGGKIRHRINYGHLTEKKFIKVPITFSAFEEQKLAYLSYFACAQGRASFFDPLKSFFPFDEIQKNRLFLSNLNSSSLTQVPLEELLASL